MIEVTRENHEAATERTVTIASISDQDWYVTRTYGVFHIPACAKGEARAVLIVTPRGDAIDLPITPWEIAEDIVQDLENHGIFVCADARPANEEISAAGAQRDAWYKQLVADADEMWTRGHSYREISDMHRRAASAMGLEREWAYVPQRSVDCPVCGEHVEAHRCRNLGTGRINQARYGRKSRRTFFTIFSNIYLSPSRQP
jgi:hypothetical protein